jgi:2-C-methyl-D-erythritol 4-phosphate cytidylyltransferase
MDRFAVILPAAGRSVRFGTGRSKLLEPLRGEPVIRHTVRAFINRADVERVVIATSSEDIDALKAAIDLPDDPRLTFCTGGATRAHSVQRALATVSRDVPWVAVHDAARPLVSQALIDRTFAAAKQYGAAGPALPVTLTVKQATGPLPAKVERTLPRHTLWAMQTPQVMRREALAAAFASCPLPLEQVTDDVQLIELAGHDVWLVEGEERNLKVTTQTDLRVAEFYLRTPAAIPHSL